MTQYAVWLLNNDYSRNCLLANAGQKRTWSKLQFRQVLNGVGSCTLEMVPSAPEIASVAPMTRILVYRNGTVVFNGVVLPEEWALGETAPQGDTYKISALDHGIYADWRVILPTAGQEYHQVADHADDVARAYVRYHMGSSAAALRQFADLTVEADAHAGASITEQARYDVMLSELQNLALNNGLRWRFVPSETGCTFTLKTGCYGTDRRKNNAGGNVEAIFSLDRRTISALRYSRDLSAHYNYIYVAGQGEGLDRTIVERSNATYITAYGRRERLVDARQLSLTASLQARGDAALVDLAPSEAMTATPRIDTWITNWGLGDYCTLYANRYGRTFAMNAEIMAVNVSVGPDSIEQAVPELVKV